MWWMLFQICVCPSVCLSLGQPVSDDISVDLIVTLTLLWGGAVVDLVFHKLILPFHLFCPVKHILSIWVQKNWKRHLFIHVFVNCQIKMRSTWDSHFYMCHSHNNLCGFLRQKVALLSLQCCCCCCCYHSSLYSQLLVNYVHMSCNIENWLAWISACNTHCC